MPYCNLHVSKKSTIFSIPDWAEQVMTTGGDLERLAFSWTTFQTSSDEMKKIKAGYLLKTILDRFSSKIQLNLSPNRSLHLYFAHDLTLANMMNSLGFYDVNYIWFSISFFYLSFVVFTITI